MLTELFSFCCDGSAKLGGEKLAGSKLGGAMLGVEKSGGEKLGGGEKVEKKSKSRKCEKKREK